jgi:hypothetical protein
MRSQGDFMGDYPVDSTELRSKGTRGVISLGAGIGLLGVQAIINIPFVGLVAGGALIVLGILGLVGKTKIDKTGGMLAIAGGVALFALKGVASFVIGAGALGLLIYGGWNVFKFVKGLKSRS